MSKPSFVELGARFLDRCWKQVNRRGATAPTVAPEINDAIVRSINSATKTYRYVLPTQLLAKCVNSALDCRSLQHGGGGDGAFDARSFCAKVVAPFDAANHNVLGGSGDPYVSNPLRVPSFSASTRKALRDKAGFDDLVLVLDFAESHAEQTEALLLVALMAIQDHLRTTHIVYPVPNRASHRQVCDAVGQFLGTRTGGLRLQVLSLALFRTVGAALQLFDSVTSANINAADSQTGKAADLECTAADGKVLMAVEVKDRELTLRAVNEKLPNSREQGIRELLFLVKGGIRSKEQDDVQGVIEREFASGQNLYVAEFDEFLSACLILFGETGRRDFLVAVGECLDGAKTDLLHRQEWQAILQSM